MELLQVDFSAVIYLLTSLQLARLSLHQIDGQEEEQMETLEASQLEDVDKEDIEYQITILEEKMSKMKPNMAAIAEYRKKVGQNVFIS